MRLAVEVTVVKEPVVLVWTTEWSMVEGRGFIFPFFWSCHRQLHTSISTKSVIRYSRKVSHNLVTPKLFSVHIVVATLLPSDQELHVEAVV